MSEKIIAMVFRTFSGNLPKIEEFIDSLGATLIFVKQTDVNRKLVVKNLPNWEDEKQNDRSSA